MGKTPKTVTSLFTVGYFMHACLLMYVFMLVCLNSMDATYICAFWFLFLTTVSTVLFQFTIVCSVIITSMYIPCSSHSVHAQGSSHSIMNISLNYLIISQLFLTPTDSICYM